METILSEVMMVVEMVVVNTVVVVLEQLVWHSMVQQTVPIALVLLAAPVPTA